MAKKARSDMVSVVEAAYAAELDDRVWLTNILHAAACDFPLHVGLAAYMYDASTLPITVGASISEAGFPGDLLPQMVAATDEAYVASTWRSIAFGTASQGEGYDELPAVKHILRPRGIEDMLALNSYDPSGAGVWVGAALPTRWHVTPQAVERWSRVAAHLAAAFRLRRRNTAREVAVLGPRGRLEHAEGEARDASAREALRSAVVALDRARGSVRRRDPDAALESWKGLVDARWTLLDRFDRDGKHFVIAVENEPIAPGPDVLSVRERQIVALAAAGASNKLVAYELGLADATVRVLISRAIRKLAVSTRAELLALVRAHLQSDSDPKVFTNTRKRQ